MKRLIVLLVVTVAFAMAQAPEAFPWWDRPIVQNLNLSPEQQQQIRATVREYRDRLIEQRANVQKAEARLQDEMNEDQVNDARANDAIDKLVAARGEIARTFSQMSLKLRMVLTPQQWQTLRARIPQQGQAQRQQMRRGPGALRKQAAPTGPMQ
jgi:Spy/CpxP family protein refolding chaperone